MPRPTALPLPLPRLFRGVALWLGLCAAAWPVAAQDQARFNVLVRGLSVAEIALATQEVGAAYALAGQVRATGLAAVFAQVRFQMQAEGVLRDGRPHPRRYAEDVDTGRRASRVELAFAEGLPRILAQSPPPGPEAVAPDAARGTVDPLSALWHVLRGGDPPCDWRLPVYDGARRSEIGLGPASGLGPITCSGHYTRVAGFSASDMAERHSFPFTATYRAQDGAFVLTEVAAMSLLGPIRIVRRD